MPYIGTFGFFIVRMTLLAFSGSLISKKSTFFVVLPFLNRVGKLSELSIFIFYLRFGETITDFGFGNFFGCVFSLIFPVIGLPSLK